MIKTDARYQQAELLARSGEKTQARILFQQIVDNAPGNVMAWLWLSELTNSLEEQSSCLEHALACLPAGPNGQKDLQTLLNDLRGAIPLPPPVTPAARPKPDERVDTFNRCRQAERLAIIGRRAEALALLQAQVRDDADALDAPTWLLYSDLEPHLDLKIHALEQALARNPANPSAADRLALLRPLRSDPLSAARALEALGETDQAADLYRLVGRRPASRPMPFLRTLFTGIVKNL